MLLHFWANYQEFVAIEYSHSPKVILRHLPDFLLSNVEVDRRLVHCEEVFLADWNGQFFLLFLHGYPPKRKATTHIG